MNRQHALIRWALLNGRFLIQDSLDLASVGQHDVQIKAPNKYKTYPSSMESAGYLNCLLCHQSFKSYTLKYFKVKELQILRMLCMWLKV